eukprot:CAMPEP_0168192740 /NCGR_PEP_ID=MMETSP0139_2-20121125/18212_1 /TAXON_ID=44445 /ORGANISM="Pseudo-nitzschia australis, Strain 10249 10 AB" /LENGTH=184 /DNA_ID=CAMNT_0008116005 /DNA_START=109 /DNA_END=664 /DNA_ORIENTATION=+
MVGTTAVVKTTTTTIAHTITIDNHAIDANQSHTGKMDKAQGFLFVVIGVLLILGPFVSLVSPATTITTTPSLSSSSSFLHNPFVIDIDQYWKDNHPYWRVLTFLPAVLAFACVIGSPSESIFVDEPDRTEQERKTTGMIGLASACRQRAMCNGINTDATPHDADATQRNSARCVSMKPNQRRVG